MIVHQRVGSVHVFIASMPHIDFGFVHDSYLSVCTAAPISNAQYPFFYTRFSRSLVRWRLDHSCGTFGLECTLAPLFSRQFDFRVADVGHKDSKE